MRDNIVLGLRVGIGSYIIIINTGRLQYRRNSVQREGHLSAERAVYMLPCPVFVRSKLFLYTINNGTWQNAGVIIVIGSKNRSK